MYYSYIIYEKDKNTKISHRPNRKINENTNNQTYFPIAPIKYFYVM